MPRGSCLETTHQMVHLNARKSATLIRSWITQHDSQRSKLVQPHLDVWNLCSKCFTSDVFLFEKVSLKLIKTWMQGSLKSYHLTCTRLEKSKASKRPDLDSSYGSRFLTKKYICGQQTSASDLSALVATRSTCPLSLSSQELDRWSSCRCMRIRPYVSNWWLSEISFWQINLVFSTLDPQRFFCIGNQNTFTLCGISYVAISMLQYWHIFMERQFWCRVWSEQVIHYIFSHVFSWNDWVFSVHRVSQNSPLHISLVLQTTLLTLWAGGIWSHSLRTAFHCRIAVSFHFQHYGFRNGKSLFILRIVH